MGVKAEFGKAVRTELRHFPVWDVGAVVVVGDYGEVSDHCFTKLGNVFEDFQAIVELDAAKPTALWEFSSAGTTVTNAAVRGGEATSAEASLVLAFESAHSLFVKAERSHVEAMANADEVGRQLRNAPRKWNRDHVFVSSVRFAKGFTLFMNTKKGSSITLEGSAPILEEVIGGRARAGTSVKVSGDAGLKAVGVTGGLYVDLMRLHWLGGTKPLRDEEVELLPVAAAITTP